LHKVALVAGVPSPQTSLLLVEFELQRHIAPDPTLFDAFGDSNPQNVLLRERTGIATNGWR